MASLSGLVVRNMGGHYWVLCSDGVERECLPKGSMRLLGIRSTSPIVIGDNVQVQIAEQGEEVCYITSIATRQNYIIRRAANLSKQSHILAANIDASFLICTLTTPETSTTFVDRFLANAEAYRVPTHLVFNKVDTLCDEGLAYLDALCQLYEGIGYPCYKVSAYTGEGLQSLVEAMQGKISLFSGHSGVGKSTLINRLIPEAGLRTGAVSEAHGQGMHTTTHSEMVALSEGGGYLIDTPGIKGFGLIEVERAEVSHYFRDLFAASEACRFANCSHTHEPGCAVEEAIKSGKIALSRYESYLSILSELDEGGKYRASE